MAQLKKSPQPEAEAEYGCQHNSRVAGETTLCWKSVHNVSNISKNVNIFITPWETTSEVKGTVPAKSNWKKQML